MSEDVIVNKTKLLPCVHFVTIILQGLTNAAVMQWNIILVFRILVRLLNRGVDLIVAPCIS